jgi:uncharacterized protein YdaU (DUF1376 family)
MNKPPAFQFYPSDFLADENVATMTNQEVGCYIKLICYCWREGSIPKDITLLSKMCGEAPDRMTEMWPSLSRCFRENGSRERLVNPRLDVEREKQENYRKHQSEAGKIGMKRRWDKGSDNKPITSLLPPVITNDNSSSSSSNIKKEIIKKESIEVPEWIGQELWSEFLAHRKKLRKPMTEYAQKLMFKKLAWAKDNGQNPTHLLKNAMLKGYQDVYIPEKK